MTIAQQSRTVGLHLEAGTGAPGDFDPPRWWHEQLALMAEQAPWIDLGAECRGQRPNRRELHGFVIEVAT